MAAIIVSTVRISDPERFKLYAAKIAGLGERYGGEYIVRGAVEHVLEGASPIGERIVVVRFPDEAAARAYVNDPAYQEAKALRMGAAEVEMRLVLA
jgi:uncharacterized protein (DUF1330 family)